MGGSSNNVNCNVKFINNKNIDDKRKILIKELDHLDIKKKNISLILELKKYQLNLKFDKLYEAKLYLAETISKVSIAEDKIIQLKNDRQLRLIKESNNSSQKLSIFNKTYNKNIAKYSIEAAKLIEDAIDQHLNRISIFVENESYEVKQLKDIDIALQSLDDQSTLIFMENADFVAHLENIHKKINELEVQLQSKKQKNNEEHVIIHEKKLLISMLENKIRNSHTEFLEKKITIETNKHEKLIETARNLEEKITRLNDQL